MRIRTTITAAFAAAVLLAGCDTGVAEELEDLSTDASTAEPGDDAADDGVTDDGDAPGGSGPEEPGLDDPAGDDQGLEGTLEPDSFDDLLAELGITVTDDEVRGLGIVLPIPRGWEYDPIPASQGALFASDGQSEPEQLLFAVAGIEEDEASGFAGADLEDAIEVVRSSVAEEPDRDEAVELTEASAAHLLEYEDVTLGGAPEDPLRSYQVVILAEDDDGMLALFNYVALLGSEDVSVTQRLLNEAGFDPDTQPLPPADEDA